MKGGTCGSSIYRIVREVDSEQKIRRMLTLMTKAGSAGMLDILRSMQIHPVRGQVWPAKWSLVTSIVSAPRDDRDFAYMVSTRPSEVSGVGAKVAGKVSCPALGSTCVPDSQRLVCRAAVLRLEGRRCEGLQIAGVGVQAD